MVVGIFQSISMDTSDIANILRVNTSTKRYFIGVFAANRLPLAPLTRPAVLIANHDTDRHGGSHWVAFYLPAHVKGVHLFDSLGEYTSNPYFKRFIGVNGGLLSYSRQRIQSYTSDVGGEYSCVFVYFCCTPGGFFNYFKRNFTSDCKLNDALVVKMFNQLYTCKAHFKRPSLGAVHAQTCTSRCHAGPQRGCPAAKALPSAPQ